MPVALPDQFIRLVPTSESRPATVRVTAVEQLPLGDEPQDFGSAAAGGGQATNADGESSIEVQAMDMDQGSIGHFRVDPVSPVKIEIRQTGAQERRLDNANEIGRITPETPPNMREVFVFHSQTAYFNVENRNLYDLDHTLVSINGWKLFYEEASVPSNVQPAVIPVDAIKQAAQAQSGGASAAGVQSPSSSLGPNPSPGRGGGR